jgi:hypothetical protein
MSSKARPHTVKHTNETGIGAPSLPAPDRGSARKWPDANAGSGSRPIRSRAPIETSAPKDPANPRNYVPAPAHGEKGRRR